MSGDAVTISSEAENLIAYDVDGEVVFSILRESAIAKGGSDYEKACRLKQLAEVVADAKRSAFVQGKAAGVAESTARIRNLLGVDKLIDQRLENIHID